MSSNIAKFLLFGDATDDPTTALQTAVELSSSSASARYFLGAAFDTLKDEVERVSPGELKNVKSFYDMLDPIDQSQQSAQICQITAVVFISITRIVEMILHIEDDPSVLGTTESPINVLAMCAGEVPAAVAVAARDAEELISLSLEVVRIQFRFYHQLVKRTLNVDQTDGNWGATLTGTTPEFVQDILDDFHDCEQVPHEQQIYIGIVSEGWVTLVGCPTSLGKLFEWSDELDELPRIDVFGRGSVHMPNLPEPYMKTILGMSRQLDTVLSGKARMMSPYNCEYRDAPTLRLLLSSILSDIAQKTMYVSKAVRRVVEDIESEEAILIVAGYTGYSLLVKKEIMAAGIDVSVSTLRNRSFSDDTKHRSIDPGW